MPDLTEDQLNNLITAIGLTGPHRGQTIAPCGTPAAYTRHVRRGEPIDDACRQANTEAKRTKGTPTPQRRKPIEHGTLKGYKQHKYRDEDACEACLKALSEYQRSRSDLDRRARSIRDRERYWSRRTYLTEEEWQARQAERSGQDGGAR